MRFVTMVRAKTPQEMSDHTVIMSPWPLEQSWTRQRLLRNRFRVDEADIAALRAGVEAAEHTGEDKDLGYAIDFLGWAHWLRGDLAEATEYLQQANAVAERIGESHLRVMSLIALALTAVRKHDTETVRTLSAQALGLLGKDDRRLAVVMSCQAWLAWQDGRPDEVRRLAGRIADINATLVGEGARYQWVHLFPVIAVRLAPGTDAEAVAEAVAAARQILEPRSNCFPAASPRRSSQQAWPGVATIPPR